MFNLTQFSHMLGDCFMNCSNSMEGNAANRIGDGICDKDKNTDACSLDGFDCLDKKEAVDENLGGEEEPDVESGSETGVFFIDSQRLDDISNGSQNPSNTKTSRILGTVAVYGGAIALFAVLLCLLKKL